MIIRRALPVALIALTVAPGCEDSCPALSTCDIREQSCQQDVMNATACLYGAPAVTPLPVSIIDAEEYIEEVTERENNQENDDGDDAQRLAAIRDANLWEEGLALLDFGPGPIEPGESSRQRLELIAAFYSPRDDAVTIFDWGNPLDDASTIITLAHEFVHALQDQNSGEQIFVAPSGLDANLARTAMVEGEAVLYQDLATLGAHAWSPDRVAWETIYERWQSFQHAAVLSTDFPFLLASLHFPYAFGSEYVQAAWQKGGNEAVRTLHSDRKPLSARQILAGYAAPEPADGPWVEALQNDAVPALGDAYRLLRSNELGAWLFDAFVSRSAGEDPSIPNSHGLRGDTLSIYVADQGDVLTFWRLRWSRQAEAEALARFVEKRWPGGAIVAWAEGERDSVIAAAQNHQRLEQLRAEGIAWQSVSEATSDQDSAAAQTVYCHRALMAGASL